MLLAIIMSWGSTTLAEGISTLRPDLPDYIFEFDLKKLYPSTWQFYKKLDIINRDKVYSFYLYHPSIQKVRHKIFKLALGKGKGKSIPRPVIIGEIMRAISEKKLGASSASVHRVTNSPSISTVNFNSNPHQSIYTFLQNYR